MDKLPPDAELSQGLSSDELRSLEAIAIPKILCAGEYLFLIGDIADRLYVVAKGRVDLCFPISLGGVTKDISVESITPGQTLGWSALVEPYRFTLSARGAEASELVAFTRNDLLRCFDADARVGLLLLSRISKIVGIRLLKMQALWARELQRTLMTETALHED